MVDGDRARRRVIGTLLMLGVGFAAALTWLGMQPTPPPDWERLDATLKAAGLAEKGDLEGAANAYRMAHATYSGQANINGLARVLLRMGQCVEARDALRKGSLDDAEASFLLSRALLLCGDVQGAKEALGRAGSYRRDHPIEPEAGAFVGSARCAECHQEEFKAQTASRHGRTFKKGAGLTDVPLPKGDVTDTYDPAVVHHLALADDRSSLNQETKVGNELFRAVAEYAFGSGDRGLTLVGHDEAGAFRELRLSRYSDPHGWQVTTGQRGRPRVATDLVGRKITEDERYGCFLCHTTDAPAAVANKGPTVADRAIGCERCHGPGGNHLAAVAAEFPDRAIAKARSGPGGGGLVLCAVCHSPRQSDTAAADPTTALMGRMDTDGARFQGMTLKMSSCYSQTGGTLDCLTCHDPHRDAVTDHTYYESKCLNCHQPGGANTKSSCSVEPFKDCVRCHMPPVPTEVPYTTFTDHWIRARRQPRTPTSAPPMLQPSRAN